MEENLEFLFNYEIRVSGVILKEDPDNKCNRVLTVTEGEESLFSFPGGKLPVKCLGEVKITLDSFLKESGEVIYDMLKGGRGKFEVNELIDLFLKENLMKLIRNHEFKTGLESELYQEIGLTTNREAPTYIENVDPYSIFFEKMYSRLLINPTFLVSVKNPDALNIIMDNKIKNGETEIKDRIWSTAQDVLTPFHNERFQLSVYCITKRLKKDGYLNGNVYIPDLL